ncbi:MAG: HAMP domain-containing histidine kinase [Oscillospiraceae bacterium]|jgi:signal transduction histidine kinase|nr:HAMP domain-containing histidine kinase [Oscillospiraceae bacterium]
MRDLLRDWVERIRGIFVRYRQKAASLPFARYIYEKKSGIAVKLAAYFLGFSAIMLALLWIFQIAFLNQFYRTIKLSRIKNVARTISNSIEDEDFETTLTALVMDSDIAVKVINVGTGAYVSYAYENNSSAVTRLTAAEIFEIYSMAKEKGEYVRYYSERLTADSYGGSGNAQGGRQEEEHANESMIYSSLVKTKSGNEILIMVDSMILPVTSTVDTLKIQLIFVSGIMFAAALLFAFVFSRRVSKPIEGINESAKILATGDYSANFSAEGFKEIRELSETLSYAAAELSKVDRLRSELIANMSHDIRTPLTLISSYGEMMRDIPGENSPENVQVIIDEARHLTELVNDMLDISKLQAGVWKLEREQFSLTSAIRSIIERYSKFTQQQGFKILFEPDCEVYVTADEMRISQVIYNLINNALNYTGSDKTVTVRQIAAGGVVRIEVSDTGEGIEEEQLPLIWDRYYKVDKEHKRARVGSGIGLSIVKGILELHGARYGVTSAKSEGTTFYFELKVI